ncbi:S-adenosyl-L-methionine-dependent methyltransferase [Patellaria atrata CBS 101060]|uniref:S-adenosyl-L-methionine-dependent methyltransferase n=1 Tax=Patellaria atrata CBS 101060 TaxID=1346257 RepID=A0A9P4S8X7_9PEZI|nr:S-adenosyl-L-methionine-dependent methyltransferase [Patellaria atrata CBS 101060]
MTQPSLNFTFDTSLVDLERRDINPTSSFTSDVTQASGDTIPYVYAQVATEGSEEEASLANEKKTPTMASSAFDRPIDRESTSSESSRPTRYVSTAEAYAAWASVYDTDGNILQAVDDLELASMLPEFLSAVEQLSGMLKIIDFGCGTGRNTVKLASQLSSQLDVEIIGIDLSPEMLSLAGSKLSRLSLPPSIRWKLFAHDFLDTKSSDEINALSSSADAIISTLVLEHFPAPLYFQSLASLINVGGYALVTNMHSEMGAKSQAGFVHIDENGKEVKIRGKSYVVTPAETVEVAKKEGFEVMGTVKERAVTQEMVDSLGVRAGKWVGVKVWYGLVLKRVR